MTEPLKARPLSREEAGQLLMIVDRWMNTEAPTLTEHDDAAGAVFLLAYCATDSADRDMGRSVAQWALSCPAEETGPVAERARALAVRVRAERMRWSEGEARDHLLKVLMWMRPVGDEKVTDEECAEAIATILEGPAMDHDLKFVSEIARMMLGEGMDNLPFERGMGVAKALRARGVQGDHFYLARSA